MCELLAPNYDADIEVKADWLELSAFFSKDGRIHLDNFVGSQDIAQDYEREDISDQDEFMEDLANSVLTEIQRRADIITDNYPFRVSEDGEILAFKPVEAVGSACYLFCLIVSHAYRSEIVPDRLAPRGEAIRKARDVFQICATLAACGVAAGPAYSIGWPRPDKTKFLEKLKQIWH